jgi:hypothetical protein
MRIGGKLFEVWRADLRKEVREIYEESPAHAAEWFVRGELTGDSGIDAGEYTVCVSDGTRERVYEVQVEYTVCVAAKEVTA